MKNEFSFSQAVEGYLLAANARWLSPHTIKDYVNTFRKFDVFLQEDPPVSSITSKQVESFLAIQTVSKKTLLNYHSGLSALWTWAVNEELVEAHIVKKVKRAKPEKRSIKPYSLLDIKAMLAALTHSRVYFRPGKQDSAPACPMLSVTGRLYCFCSILAYVQRSYVP